MPNGFRSLGDPAAPMQPISPFGFMGAGPIGMTMQQMMAQMQPNIPQVGGLLGPGAQQIMNFGFPLMQQFMMQRQLAQGMIPLGFGTGTPAQQMQAFNFMQTTNVALEQVRQRDLARIGAQPGGELAAGLLGIPIFGDVLRPFISRFLAPQGLEEGLTRGILAATRGRVPGERIAEISGALFRQFSRVGPGGQRMLDPTLTGGLTSGQLGELAFEINRRGGGMLFNEQIAGDILQRQGGVELGGLNENQRTARIQGFQVEMMRERMGRVADVLGTVNEMLGGGQPISRILDIVQSIAGKNILAAGADTTQLRRQFQQLSGLADVMGVAPQAVLAMTQAQAVGLRAQGLPGQLAVPLATQQLAQIGAAEANIISAPGFDVTRQQLARAVATGQAEAFQGLEGLRLGQFRGLAAAGIGGPRLQRFLAGETAADARRRMGILQDPSQTAVFIQQLRSETRDADLFESIISSEDMARHLEAGDIVALQGVRAERGFETLKSQLSFSFGSERANRLVSLVREGGTLSQRDLITISTVNRAFAMQEGVGVFPFISVFGGGAMRRAAFLRRAGRVTGARAAIVNQLGRVGVVQQLLGAEGGFTLENIGIALAGGGIDVEELFRRAALDPDADAVGLLKKFEADVRDALGLGAGQTLEEGVELTPAKAKKFAEITQKFGLMFGRLGPETVRGLAVGLVSGEEATRLAKNSEGATELILRDRAERVARGEVDPARDRKQVGLGPLGELTTLFDKLVSSLTDLMGGAGGKPMEIVIQTLNIQVPGLGTLFSVDDIRLDATTGAPAPTKPVGTGVPSGS